jgi:DNA-binding MarR family transcriptional regulator
MSKGKKTRQREETKRRKALSRYTEKQARYLTFIFYYTKIRGVAPAEREIQHYFGVTPPAVHNMILTMARNGLITRTPGAPRSIRLALTNEETQELISRTALGV